MIINFKLFRLQSRWAPTTKDWNRPVCLASAASETLTESTEGSQQLTPSPMETLTLVRLFFLTNIFFLYNLINLFKNDTFLVLLNTINILKKYVLTLFSLYSHFIFFCNSKKLQNNSIFFFYSLLPMCRYNLILPASPFKVLKHSFFSWSQFPKIFPSFFNHCFFILIVIPPSYKHRFQITFSPEPLRFLHKLH